MNWIEKIKNLTDAQFHYSKDSGSRIILEEIQESASCKEVIINKISKNFKTFTLALDKRKIISKTKNPQEKDVSTDIHPLLANGIEYLKKQCDYVIFCQNNQELFVLLVEMKSNNSEGWTKQTYAGEHIAKYLLGMIENCLGMNIKKVNFRHILFSNQNANAMKGRKKSKTSTQEFKYETHPDFDFFYIRKPCNTDYDLGIFLR
ncbi:MAG: hypothetical protein EAZ97_02810 [Bacteroidetes bacterium]|nr:MAG: hypothetical protein EAZ97_02810 [Bacteroidota bacterium]